MWLAIDTATDRASLALGMPGRVLARETIVGARNHASALLPALDACLARAGATREQIEGIALADGPGSFTGLRVSAALAKALVRVRPVPLWVAPSLLVCAAALPAPAMVLSVSNALRGELFAAAYALYAGRIETLLAPTVITPAALTTRVPPAVRIVGPAAPTLGGEPTWPDAADLLGLVGVAGGVRIVAEVERWEPEYGRPAEAQAQWEKTHGRPLADPARAAG
ncbi:MAG: tRNA (adenosine(37)-N6)-threonylcarbamoyltransferase complex dimerization subunit type 1 TsaB [Gemmatimonadales bacterium]